MSSPSPPDPATNAAHALASCIAAYRDLLNDDGFTAVLPLFEQLRVTLPRPELVAVPAPRGPSRPSLEDLPFPLDAGRAS